MSRVTLVAISLIWLPATSLAAGNPYLVQDLVPGVSSSAGSSVGGFEALGARILFASSSQEAASVGVWAADPDNDRVEYLDPKAYGWLEGARSVGTTRAYWWSRDENNQSVLLGTDGTAAGTRELHRAPSFPFYGQQRSMMGTVGDRLLFSGFAEDTGWELWASDGTMEGTGLLVDLRPGGQGGQLESFVALGNRVCFVASSGSPDSQLTCTDGTASGTRVVAAFSSIDTFDFPPVAISDRIYFLAWVDQGFQLATTDGTTGGTSILTALPGGYPFRSRLLPRGDHVYFVADNVVNGSELWRSDGTVSGTKRITEFGFHDPFSRGLDEDWVAELDGHVYFCAHDGLSPLALWRTDGTPQSTEHFGAEGCEFVAGSHSTRSSSLSAIDGRLVLVAKRADVGAELFAASPTGQLSLLLDFCPGPCSGIEAPPRWVDGLLLFDARGADGRTRILRTDGTPQGTHEVAEVPGGSAFLALNFAHPTTIWTGRWLAFTGWDPLHGFEPWLSTLSPPSAGLLADLTSGAGSSYPTSIRNLGDGVVFRSCESQGPSWSYSSGAIDDVVPLGFHSSSPLDCGQEDDPPRIEVAAGFAFLIDGFHGSILRRTDGTATGSIVLLDVPSEQRLRALTSGGERVWFIREGGTGTALWSSNGTVAGTKLERALTPQVSAVGNLAWVEGRIAFAGEDSSGTSRVWVYEPSAGVLDMLAIDLGSWFPYGGSLPEFVGWNGGIYFFSRSDDYQTLWRYEVGTETTEVMANLGHVARLYGFGSGPTGVYFLELSPLLQLWRSTGSPAGTGPVRALSASYGSDAWPTPSWTAVGGWTVFRVHTQEHGLELWATDGTAEGTFLLPEVQPGSASSAPGAPVVVGNHVYFLAEGAAHGRELWFLNASNGSLSRVSDIAPGARSSFASELVATETHLFLRASDGLHGHELWAAPHGESGCSSSSRSLCIAEGRFQVEAFWRDFFGGSGDGVAVPLTSDTGYFWFFDETNVEAVIKVLDAIGVNNRFWVFYGALSNVEYSIDVTDTTTRVKRRYFNPAGRYASVGDVDAFDPAGSVTAGPTNEIELAGTDGRPLLLDAFAAPTAASGSCAPSSTRLCLQQGRFAVEAIWRDFQGHTGVGTAVALSADTGYFWFFADTNVEAILKVLDGRPVNDKFWVYYGALSNVEYTIAVTDTVTGDSKVYFNPAGRYASVGDNDAF